MLAVCSMTICFAAEDNKHNNSLQPTPRILERCTTSPDPFIVVGKLDLTNTDISSKEWLCSVTESGTVVFTSVSPKARQFQSCQQGLAQLTVSINNIPFAKLTQNAYACIIGSTGTVSFMQI